MWVSGEKTALVEKLKKDIEDGKKTHKKAEKEALAAQNAAAMS